MRKKKIVVVGAGLGGLSAAAHLAHAGHAVTVVEQLPAVGGRAQVWRDQGWSFDIGPSWYWMPEEHDAWFAHLGLKREDYYDIVRLDPSFKVFFKDSTYRIPADNTQIGNLFEQIEPGGREALQRYLTLCKRRYEIAKRCFIYTSYRSPWQMIDSAIFRYWSAIRLFRSYQSELDRFFHNRELQKILTYPVVFLGSDAKRTPAVYTLMNWIDIGLGTWYPQGGFGAVVAAMRKVAEEMGVRFALSQRCVGFSFAHAHKRITEVVCVPATHSGQPQRQHNAHADNSATMQPISYACLQHRQADSSEIRDDARRIIYLADAVVANGDYPAIENLLPTRYRSYTKRYWGRRTLSPAVMNFYLGLDTVFEELEHHSFFFDGDWDTHFAATYRTKGRIEHPLFYTHYPVRTDRHTAPPGCSALFILIPVASGESEINKHREYYFNHCCERIKKKIGRDIRPHIRTKRSMSIPEFEQLYSAFQGNAFGLGHTLWQTAAFRPCNKSRRINNLYYCGHYTIPGTGTTMSTISGTIAAKRLIQEQCKEKIGSVKQTV